MFGGVVVYEVISAEQQVFEIELERKRRYQDAVRAVSESSGAARGRIGAIAASIRKLRSGAFADQVAVSGNGAAV